ncbi:anti-sigma factor [Lichenihabitans sp. PAMC28606]|uniref:anti-sigma factor family protein n=1 Tax=Lichenihabitans sp. PAMC28606 TaxID=2880932 RepID=UPI001D0A09DE|nr:anti-sigma factor [Lichenihabitans sp. PAMC28606]UDL94429.1 anti-sigma factor [Lichenihabitans sp. PAMC28606]
MVAYLDGELSPSDSVRMGQQIAADRDISNRIDVLMRGGRPFQDAFAPLLAQAPLDKLDVMLTEVVERRQPALRRGAMDRRFWPAAVAAGVVLMALGAGLDRLVVSPFAMSFGASPSTQDETAYWRRAVTQYLSLFTSETLSIIPDTADAKRQELASLGSRLGLDLNPQRVDFPNMVLKRAEMFDYDGRALAFLAYLDPKNGPVSICIIASGGHDAPTRIEHRRGMTVVYWSKSGRSFMLIGRGNLDDLQARASLVASRFDGMPSDHATDDAG